jgi:hypothetical protein
VERGTPEEIQCHMGKEESNQSKKGPENQAPFAVSVVG